MRDLLRTEAVDELLGRLRALLFAAVMLLLMAIGGVLLRLLPTHDRHALFSAANRSASDSPSCA